MRLFHVSEEASIEVFHPRTPTRADLDQETKLVWAIDEAHLPNFLTPRECPRVTWHPLNSTNKQDMATFFSSPGLRHGVAIEQVWFRRMQQATLTIYEFDPANFVLQDAVAGYHVSTKVEIPIKIHRITDVFGELFAQDVELRIVDNLWPLCRRIQASSLGWSMCKMANALPEAAP